MRQYSEKDSEGRKNCGGCALRIVIEETPKSGRTAGILQQYSNSQVS